MEKDNINFIIWQHKIDNEVLQLWKADLQQTEKWDSVKVSQTRLWHQEKKGNKNENK